MEHERAGRSSSELRREIESNPIESTGFAFLIAPAPKISNSTASVGLAKTRPVTSVDRAVRSSSGRSRGDCRKSGTRRIAASDRMNRGHPEFDGPGHER